MNDKKQDELFLVGKYPHHGGKALEVVKQCKVRFCIFGCENGSPNCAHYIHIGKCPEVNNEK